MSDRLERAFERCLVISKSRTPRYPKHSEESRKAMRLASRKHYYKYPIKSKARSMANSVLTEQPCEVCGSADDIEKHHFDYSKPLEVIFLCNPHHTEIHSWDSIYNKFSTRNFDNSRVKFVNRSLYSLSWNDWQKSMIT